MFFGADTQIRGSRHTASNSPRRLARIAAVLLLVAIAPTFNESLSSIDILARPLEAAYARPDCIDFGRTTGIIVLGGGYERLQEAAELAKRHSHLKIFVTGGGTTAELQRYFGPALAPRLMVDERARTTRENALNTRGEIAPADGTWLLLTSAIHMPRATYTFSQVGLDPVPWPVYDLHTSGRSPLVSALREWAGLGWYHLRGWTSERPAKVASCGKEHIAEAAR